MSENWNGSVNEYSGEEGTEGDRTSQQRDYNLECNKNTHSMSEIEDMSDSRKLAQQLLV